jgi:hypothetical protein
MSGWARRVDNACGRRGYVRHRAGNRGAVGHSTVATFDGRKSGMTFDQLGRTVLFMAPPSDQEAEPESPAPHASDEVMSRLRNPFQPTATEGAHQPTPV